MGGWLPEDWPKTVVLLEERTVGDTGESFRPLGTGCLLGYQGVSTLVTAAHVLSGAGEVFVSFNRKVGGVGKRPLVDVEAELGCSWQTLADAGADVAVIPVAFDRAQDDVKVIPESLFEFAEGLEESQDVFFLGFPLGVRNVGDVRPLVRAGIVALKRDDRTLLIDGNVFPGSSGSPVFLKPTMIDLKTRSLGRIEPARFIGIISGYLPYEDVAVSSQSRRPRVVFEENSGLGVVESTDRIREALESEGYQKALARAKEMDSSETDAG